MTVKEEKLKWYQLSIDTEYHPHFFSWKECINCKMFFNNDEDGILTKEIEWICLKCNVLISQNKDDS